MKITKNIFCIAFIITMLFGLHPIRPVSGITQHLANNSFESEGAGGGSDAAGWTEGSYGRYTVSYSGNWGMWLYGGETAYQTGLWVDSDVANYFKIYYKSNYTVKIVVYYDESTYSDKTCGSSASWTSCSLSSFVGDDHIVKVEFVSLTQGAYFDLAQLISGITK